MTFASKKVYHPTKKRILLKTQGFVVEPGNWNYVFNVCVTCVYLIFADQFTTWSLIAGKPPSPSSSYSSSPLLMIRHHHHHHHLVQVFRIKLPSGARERGRLIHRRDINQVPFMSWRWIDEDHHDNNDDDRNRNGDDRYGDDHPLTQYQAGSIYELTMPWWLGSQWWWW